MLRIDRSIYETNEVICENISNFGTTNRGLLSQNILSQIRNFVEYIVVKEFSNGEDVSPNDYDFRKEALSKLMKRGDLRFLSNFHNLLQKSVSHYTVDKDGSERLMLKYYEYFLKIKMHLREKYKMDVLDNIEDFPLNTDTEMLDYYRKISEKIEKRTAQSRHATYDDRYYIQKIKPFFIDENIYYEVTFTIAYANTSKFDRVIAFTKEEIFDNYSVKLSIHSDVINILDNEISILIIDSFQVAIRPCELDNFSEIFGARENHSINSNEYKLLMNYLSKTKLSLTDLVCSEQSYYDEIKNIIHSKSESTKIFNLLDSSRLIIINNQPGANILRYLLYKMNNRIIKLQTNREQCGKLSNLYLSYGCIPFDQMPFCSSLIRHNPRIYDLIQSVLVDGREHEFFARLIKNNTEIEGQLFTPKNSIDNFANIDSLIKKHNDSLYYKHDSRKLIEYNRHIYIKEYVEDSTQIIKELQNLSSSGISQYTPSVDSWLQTEMHGIDDDNKKEILRSMFSNSKVALIYGSAGTGKSTLIKHISDFWASENKIFLANTHPAVGNLKRRVTSRNSDFSTIASFLSSKNLNTDCEVLIIDECSTVSNRDMRSILEKATFKLLILVGDTFQIESIYFGNWFNIAQKFISSSLIYELDHPYRTTNSDLITVWNRVRNLDAAILEPLVKNNYVSKLDETIFDFSMKDEIILCLNYDGLYGINNINRFIQSKNPNPEVFWGINVYKIGDPILFNESNMFSPLIHNNTKGKIVDIRIDKKRITFDIEIDLAINEFNSFRYDFELIGISKTGNSIISFSINKYRSTDEDDDYDSTVIPFQVAYAVSIHKAQGLEYDSVKVVISNEVEERITHNIFYTAITRAKNSLKIFWTPETGQTILERFEKVDTNKEAHLLANFIN